MADEGKAQASVETQTPSESGKDHFSNLSLEVQLEVTKKLITDNKLETVRNLNRLAQVSRTTAGVVNSADLYTGGMRARLNRLAVIANDLHDKVLEGGISNQAGASEHSPRDLDPVAAKDQVSAIAPVSQLLSSKVKRKFVQDIHEIPNKLARVESTGELSSHFKNYKPESTSLLINDAIKILADGGPAESRAKSEAAKVIVRADVGGYLTKEHREQIEDLNNSGKGVETLLVKMRQLNDQEASRAPAIIAEDPVAAKSEKINDDVEHLHNSLKEAVSDDSRHKYAQLTKFYHPKHLEVDALREVSKSISEAMMKDMPTTARDRSHGR